MNRLLHACAQSLLCVTFSALSVLPTKPLLALQITPSALQELATENSPRDCPLLVISKIDGVDGFALIDTGASIHGLSWDFKDELTLVIPKRPDVILNTPNGKIQVSIVESRHAIINSEPYLLDMPGSLNLEPLSKVIGCKLIAIVGLPLIAKHGLTFNSSSQTAQIGSRDILTEARRYRLRYRNSEIYIKSVSIVDGSTEQFQVDTGQSMAVCFSKDRFNELLSQGMAKECGSCLAETMNGTVSMKLAVLSKLTLFDHVFQNVLIGESSSNRIGMDLLGRFDFYIEPKCKFIQVADGVDIDRPFLADQSGLSLICDDGNLVVKYIRESSPAEKAGISKNDVIESINLIPFVASWQSLGKVREQLSDPKSYPITLEVRTDTDKRKVQLNLK